MLVTSVAMAATSHALGSPVFEHRVCLGDPLVDTRRRLEWAITDGCDEDLVAEINRALVMRHGRVLADRGEDGRTLCQLAETCGWMSTVKSKYLGRIAGIVRSGEPTSGEASGEASGAVPDGMATDGSGGRKRGREEAEGDDEEMEEGVDDPAEVWLGEPPSFIS